MPVQMLDEHDLKLVMEELELDLTASIPFTLDQLRHINVCLNMAWDSMFGEPEHFTVLYLGD